MSLLILSVIASPALAGLIFWDNDEAGFHAQMATVNAALIGIEDFEGSTLTAPSNQNLFTPLTQGVANGAYPAGLTQPMTVRANIGGADAPTITGGGTMLLVPAGSRSSDSDIVTNASTAQSLDMVFFDPLGGVGTDIIQLQGNGTVRIRVYSVTEVLLGEFLGAGTPTGANFVGIETTGGDQIGRLNFWATSGTSVMGGDDVQLFAVIPEPSEAAIALVGLSGLLGARRRKRR